MCGHMNKKSRFLDLIATFDESVEWHLGSMRILSTCCIGKSPDNEVKAQSSVTWRDVVTKLLSPSLHR